MTARKRGRPAADGPRIAVRLTDAQAKALERVATKAGIPLSTYLREAALRAAGLAHLSESARVEAALGLETGSGEARPPRRALVGG